MTEVLLQTTFQTWVIRTQMELATLGAAAARQDWQTAQVSIDTLNILLEERPAGDYAAVNALLTAARNTVDDVYAAVSDVRSTVGAELRQLSVGRRALKAYS